MNSPNYDRVVDAPVAPVALVAPDADGAAEFLAAELASARFVTVNREFAA